MMDVPEITSNEPVKKNQLFSLYPCKFKDKTYYAKCFNNEAVEQMDLEACLSYNLFCLSYIDKYEYPEFFLRIENSFQTNKGFLHLTETYQVALDEYIQNKSMLDEKEALKIFQQILKIVYCLQNTQIGHDNLRPEHFVKIGNRWKLATMITEKEQSGYQSEYISSKKYRTPEAYEKGYESYQKKLVWNLGCILVHMLTGSHKLNSFQAIRRFRDKEFSFQSLGMSIGSKFSQQLVQSLGQMCHYNVSKRMSLEKLLRKKLFVNEQLQIKNVPLVKKNNQQIKVQSGIVQFPEKNLPQNAYIKYSNIDEEKGNVEQKEITYRPNQQINKFEKSSFIPNYTNQSFIKVQTSSLKKTVPQYDQSQLRIIIENDVDISGFIELYQSQLSKCEIMQLQQWNFSFLRKSLGDTEQVRCTVLLFKYYILFICKMLLHKLVSGSFAQEKRNLFIENLEDFSQYKKTEHYSSIIKKAKNMIEKFDKKMRNIRGLLEQNSELQMPKVQDYKKNIFKLDPQQTDYTQIKNSYRIFLFNFIMNPLRQIFQKSREKNIILHLNLTLFCLAFDKLYLNLKQIHEKFKEYFIWMNKKPSCYIDSKKYFQYLNSRSIVELQYKYESIIKDYFDFTK